MPGKAIDLDRPAVVVAASASWKTFGSCVEAFSALPPDSDTAPWLQRSASRILAHLFSETSLRNFQGRMTKGDDSRRNRKFTIAITLIDLLNLKYA